MPDGAGETPITCDFQILKIWFDFQTEVQKQELFRRSLFVTNWWLVLPAQRFHCTSTIHTVQAAEKTNFGYNR